MIRKLFITIYLGLSALTLAGCGTTKGQIATEQMVVSDAVDRSVAAINFTALAGQSVYLDTQYMKSVKGAGFVNADYIISSLRQQMVAANCHLEEQKESADYIVEARVGALGTDKHDVTYGIPASASLSSAASLVPNAPPIPMIPEIAIAKRADQVGAAKIAVFAYHRETRTPVWQSGIAKARSTSKDIWLFGAGPFQRGTVNDHTRFAGEKLKLPLLNRDEREPMNRDERDPGYDAMTLYSREVRFNPPPGLREEPAASEGTAAQTASFAKDQGGGEKAAVTEEVADEKMASKPDSTTEKK